MKTLARTKLAKYKLDLLTTGTDFIGWTIWEIGKIAKTTEIRLQRPNNMPKQMSTQNPNALLIDRFQYVSII